MREEFLDDVGIRPSAKHSLGRIETNGNYEVGNCRWETSMQQWRNRRVALVSENNLQTWFGSAEGTRIWGIIQNNYLICED